MKNYNFTCKILVPGLSCLIPLIGKTWYMRNKETSGYEVLCMVSQWKNYFLRKFVSLILYREWKESYTTKFVRLKDPFLYEFSTPCWVIYLYNESTNIIEFFVVFDWIYYSYVFPMRVEKWSNWAIINCRTEKMSKKQV